MLNRCNLFSNGLHLQLAILPPTIAFDNRTYSITQINLEYPSSTRSPIALSARFHHHVFPYPAHVKYLESSRKNNHANGFSGSLLAKMEEGLIKTHYYGDNKDS